MYITTIKAARILTAVTIERWPRPLRLADDSDCRKKLEDPLLDQEDRSLTLAFSLLSLDVLFHCVSPCLIYI